MRNLSSAFALPLRASAFAGALLALATSLPAPAGASTVNLRWNDCWGDGGAANRSFACNTNSGSQLLVGSFISPFAVPGVVRHDVLVEVALNAASVPAWWMFRNTGTCRQYSLTVRATPPVTAVQCIPWARTFTLGAILTYVTIDPNIIRISAATTVPSDGAADIVPGQEYFSFQLMIDNAKSVGTGACAGCDVGACITLRQIYLRTLDEVHNQFLFNGGMPGDQASDARVLWQLTATPSICSLSTPTRNRTWGEVKALYR